MTTPSPLSKIIENLLSTASSCGATHWNTDYSTLSMSTTETTPIPSRSCENKPWHYWKKLKRSTTVDKVENEVDGLYVTLKNQHKTNTYFPSSLQVRASLKV
jgi:hypothetical protein